jgi:hypothetical protein
VSNDSSVKVPFGACLNIDKTKNLTVTMTKKKFKAGDKLKIVAGKHIGRTGEHRRDTDKGKDMGCVSLARDNCERKLWKTSMVKISNAAGCNVQRKKFMPGDKLKLLPANAQAGWVSTGWTPTLVTACVG